MPEEFKAGCARPTGGPVGETVEKEETIVETKPEEISQMIKVGKKRRIFPHRPT